MHSNGDYSHAVPAWLYETADKKRLQNGGFHGKNQA